MGSGRAPDQLAINATTYDLEFENELDAAKFVEELVHDVRDVAVFRDGVHVRVFDAGSQREEVFRMAQAAGAIAGASTVG